MKAVKSTRQRTPAEVKAMKIINISVLSLVGALAVGSVLCAIYVNDETAFAMGGAIIILLWNLRVVRRKYARGL